MCKITIITITYNSESTLEKTILSIINQKYENLEYILIDGGSTDNTMKIVGKYQKYFAKIVSETDNGIADAFNKGISYATGDVICMMNSDDTMPQGVAQIVANNYCEDVDVYYGDVIVVNETLGYKSKQMPSLLTDFEYTLPFCHQSTYVSRKAYEKYGVYSLDYRLAMDYELLLKMYKRGAKFKYIPNVLSEFRRGGSSSVNIQSVAQEVKNISIKYGANKFKTTIFYYRFKGFCLLHEGLKKLKLLKFIQGIRRNSRVKYDVK